jgi:hypothetical protein
VKWLEKKVPAFFKGTVSRDFLLLVFFMNQFLPSLVSTTPAAMAMGTISGCRCLKVNLKAKIYIYVKFTIQRCPNKIIKIFLIEDFFHLLLVSATPVVNLELRISPKIFEKIRNGSNRTLWGWGETDS